MRQRYIQLDSIRGIAALTVIFYHIFDFNKSHLSPAIYKIIMISPFKLLVFGHPAVILFFVLSGFVLSLPFIENNKVNYTPYIIKRIFRIYIPYLFSILLSLFLLKYFVNRNISLKYVSEHLLLIGNIHSNAYNVVVWSLVHEMRISFIFPFVVLVIKKLDLKINILICLLLSLSSYLNQIFHFQNSNGLNTTYFDSLQYLSIFIMGSLVAIKINALSRKFSLLPIYAKFLILVFSVLLYGYSDDFLIKIVGIPENTKYFLILNEYFMAIGATGFIIIAINSVKFSRMLSRRPILSLGKISYSLYLFHFPVSETLHKVLLNRVPWWEVFVLSVIASIIVAYIVWLLVEKPSIFIGKKLANKLISSIKMKIEKEREVKVRSNRKILTLLYSLLLF
jgi:peptidoglycan/LPS O-acetylase OafA/YrhL